MTPAGIEDYGLLSDCQSAALVGRDGSVDWWCQPRFDAPAVFARLLDDDAGHWSIRPDAPFTVSRAYVDRSLALRTVFHTQGGAVAVTDALALEPNGRGHDIGRWSCGFGIVMTGVVQVNDHAAAPAQESDCGSPPRRAAVTSGGPTSRAPRALTSVRPFDRSADR